MSDRSNDATGGRVCWRMRTLVRAIADLAEAARVEAAHVSEAVQYRACDRTTL